MRNLGIRFFCYTLDFHERGIFGAKKVSSVVSATIAGTTFIYHYDLEKQGGCGVVAHESHMSQLSDCYENEAIYQISLLF